MSGQGTITFVPSVHFSPTHRRRVRRVIRETDPDLVAVELDERRFERIEENARRSPMEVARSLPPATAATYSTLRALQRTVVRLYGLDPDETDMESAILTAAEIDVDVALIDDPLKETLTALSSRVGLTTLPRLLLRVQKLGPRDYATQLEAMTLPFREIESGDDVQPVIDQLRQLLPEVAEVLIDRRDRAMAERLHALRQNGYDVVAVIGAGHHNGTKRELQTLNEQTTDEDVAVPVRTPSRNVTRLSLTES